MVGIYKIENLINNKIYVGSSINIKKRFNSHLSYLRKNKHCNKHLQRSFNKYGENNFKFEIIELLENFDFNNKKILKESLLLIEQKWIDKLIIINGKNDGYNICLKSGSCLGIKLSDDHKKKLSESKKGKKNPQYGRKYTKEEKEKLRQYSLNMSDEARKKIGEVSKGNKYRLGTKHSDEARKKISESNKGKRKGIIISDETRKKISEAGKGRIVSKETRDKKRQSMLGKKRNKNEQIKSIINSSRRNEIILQKETKIIYCFNMVHAGYILNVNPKRIQKAVSFNRKCEGYDVFISIDNFYKKEILLKNIDLFDKEKNIPNNKLITILKNKNEK